MPETMLVPAGTRFFDTNTVVSARDAQLMYAHARRYRGVFRYIRRDPVHINDLSVEEVATLHAAGLAVAAVQHVESERSWLPSLTKGHQYGTNAVIGARHAGLPAGSLVFCDLEGVSVTSPESDVDAYVREWAHCVTSSAYVPGLYVGYRCGLSPRALYRLPVAHYWAAYNLNADEYPDVVGVQVRQHAARANDIPDGMLSPIDVDVIQEDMKGRLPTAYAPDGWDV